MEKDIEIITLFMARENLDGLPGLVLPGDFSFRFFRPGDEEIWAGIESSVNEFPGREAAAEHFRKEFGAYPEEIERRCFFLVHDPDGRCVGTATAWFGIFRGRQYGRVHWVGIRPEFQGEGLGRPLVGRVLEVLAGMHDRAYLTTRTISCVAIGIYLDCGFEPVLFSQKCRRGWEIVSDLLGRPGLAEAGIREYG